MSAENPPTYNFPGIEFNPTYFINESISSGFTEEQANALYLKKKIPDTATALETFNVGIKTNSIEPINATDTVNINTVSSTAINIVNIGNNTTNEQTLNLNSKTINIGDTSVPSSVNILSTSIVIGNPSSGTISFGSSAITTQITPSTSSMYLSNIGPANGDFNLCLLQNTGNLNIGTSTTRTAAINIGTGKTTGSTQIINIGSNVITSGTQTINLGGSQTISGGGSQTINVNKPLTIGYTVNPTSLNQIGGSSFVDALEQPFPSTGGTITLATLSTIPIGIYNVFYNISTTITVATATLTERAIAISSVSADTTLANTINFMRDSDLLNETRIVGHDMTVTGGGIFVNTTASVAIYLNQRFIFTAGPTVRSKGHLRIVRIG
jgi:hypothetical protein